MAQRGVNKMIIVHPEYLYLSGCSIPEVSEKTGIPRSTLRFRLKKSGVLRARAEGLRVAAKKGRLSKRKGVRRTFSEEWKRNISKAKKGIGSGLSKKPNGYIEITMGDNKGKGQHRAIMEEHLGRPLESGEVVHHINHNRSDNRLENLEVMSRSSHCSHHAKQADRARNKKGQYI